MNKRLTNNIDNQDNRTKSYHKTYYGALPLEHAFNAIKDPIAIIDMDFKIVWANDLFSKILNIEPDDICRQICYKLLRAADEPSDCCLCEDTFKGDRRCPAEVLNKRFGNCLWVATHPICNEVEKLTGTSLVIHDTNKVNKKQDGLCKSKSRLHTLMSTSSDFIYFKDDHGRWIEANQACIDFFELKNVDYKGKKDSEVAEYSPSYKQTFLACEESDNQVRRENILPRSKEALQTSAGAKCSAGEVIESEIAIQTKIGLRELYVKEIPIYDHLRERIKEVCIIGRDMTEKMKIEERFRQAHKMEALGTLAEGIAHDFNNILMSIIGYAELSLFDIQENSQAKRHIAEVLNSANRARDLVARILSFSRQEKRNLRPVNVHKTIDEVLKLLRSAISSNIEIRQKIDSKKGYILSDRTELYQIIMNLCVNAAHAMRKEGGVLSVGLKSAVLDKSFTISHPDRHNREYMILTVSDTGEGIPPNNIKKIFDPYFTTKSQGKGTGIGLSVAHGILKDMGGHIHASSKLGEGTVFTIFLPKLQHFGIEQKKGKKARNPRGREHILVVDDEYPIVRMTAQSLEYFGYTVTMRTSSIEALEAFKKNSRKFDAVITDLTMPNMNGDQLIQEIKKIRTDIPIVLCTGYSESLNPTLLAVGAIRFQMKPASGYDLAVSLRSIIDNEVATQCVY